MRSRVPAGILTSVLAVSLIIATLCASLITLAYYYRMATVQHTAYDRLDNNARSGINVLLATSESSTYVQGRWRDLFGQGQDSVWLQQRSWGLYPLAIAQAQHGGRSRRQMALLGHRPDELGRSALYLADEQRPLAIAGNTQLKGMCYLPKAGIKSAYVNRVGYQGQQLVAGTTRESKRALPTLSSDIVKSLRQIAHIADYQVLPSLADSLSHSFAESPLYYHQATPVTLNGTLQGNVVISSDQAVTITERARVDNIIVRAPRVMIESGFAGRLQAIATDTLVVGREVQLHYPSALVLNTNNRGTIRIEEFARVAGTLAVVGVEANYHQRLLHIATGASVTGMVYADGLVSLKGSILGHLSCRKFLLQTPSTLYENHILDGTVDATQRSEHYLASPLWGATTQKGIVQWLD